MSYILDAIKKSEAERNQGIAPGALAGSAAPPRPRSSFRTIGLVVAINLAALGGWWWWQNMHVATVADGAVTSGPATDLGAPPPTGLDHPTSQRVTDAEVAATSAPAMPAGDTQSAAPPTVVSPPAVVEGPTIVTPDRIVTPAPVSTEPPPEQTSDSLALSAEAPPSEPDFSTHVYAEDPSLRAVTLHGRRLVEGDLIEPGMRLIEITETGVIVDYHGKRMAFDVLQDWRSE